MENFLSIEDAIKFAQEVVEEQGADFVYNPNGTHDCKYVSRSDPRWDSEWDQRPYAPGAEITGCLIGRILDKAGLLSDQIVQEGMSIISVIADARINTDHTTRFFLQTVQGQQDQGATWGDALTAGLNTVRINDPQAYATATQN